MNSSTAGTAAPATRYAAVNGLRMFYGIHGAQPDDDPVPILLLHGAYMTTADFGPLLPGLAAQRRVMVRDPHLVCVLVRSQLDTAATGCNRDYSR